MTAVGEWLRQIVLIVLFAVVADLLLPNKEMQRYVRMVLGLAVIAAMLQPLHVLVQSGWADRVAGLAASEVLSGANQNAQSASLEQFQTVLQSEQEKEANHYLAESLKTDIQSKFGVPVASVQIHGQPGSSSFGVDIVLSVERGDLSQIRAFTASTLEIPSNRVSVRAMGG